MEKQHITTEDMLDVLADHIKSLIADAGTSTNTASIAPLLEIYFRYSRDDVIPHYYWRENQANKNSAAP